MKKSLIAFLAVVLIAFPLYTAGAATSGPDPAVPATGSLESIDPEVTRIGRLQDAVQRLYQCGVLSSAADVRPLDPISRAEAIASIVRALGLDEDAQRLAGASIFSDCANDAWYSGYLTVAAARGIIAPRAGEAVRPDDGLTQIEMVTLLIRALGYEPEAQIRGGYPSGYLALAAEIGLIESGIAVDDLWLIQMQQPVSRGAFVLELERVLFDIPASDGFTLAVTRNLVPRRERIVIHASSDTAKLGDEVFFTAEVVDEYGQPIEPRIVQWFVDRGEILNGRLTATHTGLVRITAVSGELSTTKTIYVNGEPAYLRVDAPEVIVANNHGAPEAVVQVLDRDGEIVTDFEGIIRVNYAENGSNGAVRLGNRQTLRAQAGTARFTLRATDLPHQTDQILFSAQGLEPATITVTSVPQVPTAIALQAEADRLQVNQSDTVAVKAVILDQEGVPVISGVYPVLFSISGQGTFDDGSVESQEQFYLGSQGQQGAVCLVSSIKGEPGSILVTAESEGLEPAAKVLKAVIARTPKALRVSVDRTSLVASDWSTAWEMPEALAHVTVEIVDSGGTSLKLDRPLEINLSYSHELTGHIYTAPLEESLVIPQGHASLEFEMAVSRAGDWLLEFSDSEGQLTSESIAISVSAAPPALAQFQPGDLDGDGHLTEAADWIAIGSDTVALEARICDRFGNPLSLAQAPLRFRVVSPQEPQGEGIINDYTADVLARTGASGAAAISFKALMYPGDTYQLTAAFDADTDGVYETLSHSPYLKVMESLPAAISVSVLDQVGRQASSVTADEGNYLTINAKVLDKHNHPVGAGYRVAFDILSGGGTLSPESVLTNGSGVAAATFYPSSAGSSRIAVRVINAHPELSANRNLSTGVGSPVRMAVLSPDGEMEPVPITADGVHGPFYLTITDFMGNLVPAQKPIVVSETDLYRLFGGGFSFRTTRTGLNTNEITVGTGAVKTPVYIEAYEGQTVHPSADTLSRVGPPGGVTITYAGDDDHSASGLTGEDFSAQFEPSQCSDFSRYDVYILPSVQQLDIGSDIAVDVLITQEDSSWQGDATVTVDSRGQALDTGMAYRIWIATVDTDGLATPVASSPLSVTAEP